MAEGVWGPVLTLTHIALDEFPENLVSENPDGFTSIVLSHNKIKSIPTSLSLCLSLQHINLAHNHIATLPVELFQLPNLKICDLNSNRLDQDSIPSDIFFQSSLETLVLSNNQFTEVPAWVLRLTSLTNLHFGANKISYLSNAIGNLSKLLMLYLGGNRLQHIPEEIGELKQLKKLVISDNQLASIPESLGQLSALRTLMLHGNKLKVLPTNLLELENLEELSLRNNPLVSRFIREMLVHPYSLKELTARYIVNNQVWVPEGALPFCLEKYLESSNRCVNPACSGVYFSSRFAHVKFVDFCGKYRVPLMQYLCSPTCQIPLPIRQSSSSDDQEEFREVSSQQMQRVLLG